METALEVVGSFGGSYREFGKDGLSVEQQILCHSVTCDDIANSNALGYL